MSYLRSQRNCFKAIEVAEGRKRDIDLVCHFFYRLPSSKSELRKQGEKFYSFTRRFAPYLLFIDSFDGIPACNHSALSSCSSTSWSFSKIQILSLIHKMSFCRGWIISAGSCGNGRLPHSCHFSVPLISVRQTHQSQLAYSSACRTCLFTLQLKRPLIDIDDHLCSCWSSVLIYQLHDSTRLILSYSASYFCSCSHW